MDKKENIDNGIINMLLDDFYLDYSTIRKKAIVSVNLILLAVILVNIILFIVIWKLVL